MKNIHGFYFVEFIVTIVILAILSTVVIVRWPGETINLNAQAQQLASDIRYTQSLAMTHGQRYRLNLVSTNQYTITTIGGTALNHPVTGSTTTTLGTGIIYGTFTNLPNNLIAFDGAGIPYTNSAATIALAATATVRLTFGSQTKTVQISPETGNVVVQ
jgi:type II secretory pathway pseudopilin PulG